MRFPALCLSAFLLAAPPSLAADAGATGEASSDDLTYTPSAALSSGYDSNPDEEPDGPGSGFAQGDLGLRIQYDDGPTEVDFRLEGQHRQLWDNEDPERWYYRASIDAETEVSEGKTVEAGLKRLYDELLLPQTINDTAYVAFRNKAEPVDLRLETFVERESDGSGEDEFEYRKYGARTRFAAEPERMLSPFLRTGYSYVEFPNQDTEFIDRDGHDLYAVAGLTWRPTSKLRIDAGGRFNIRVFEGGGRQSYDNGFFDLDLEWEPTDDLTITAAIQRRLDEPGSELGVVEDETTYRVGLTWDATDRIKVKASGSYKEEEEIDADETKEEWEALGRLAYELTDDFSLFAETTMIWNREEEPDDPVEKFERFTLSGGVETTF